MKWVLLFSRQAGKDAVKIKQAGLQSKADVLLDLLEKDPFQNPPQYEKLLGDLTDIYSRRINIQHRMVYRVDKSAKHVFIERMWTHYR